MSLIGYDINALREAGAPAESLADWAILVTECDRESAYYQMVDFYYKWGDRVFWLYKDQQMIARSGKVLTDSQKQEYIAKMLSGLPT